MTVASHRLGPVRSHDVAAAALLAHELLEGQRLEHSRSAAAAASRMAATVRPQDGALLVAAAWLHDVGYGVPRTGFHPLDGALHLQDQGWPGRLVALVAHHSYAIVIAPEHGLARELAAFPREEGPVADALVYADMVSAPSGERWSAAQRLADMRRRHDPVSRLPAHHRRRREVLLTEAVRRARLRASVVGLSDTA